MASALTKPRYKSYQDYLDDDSLSPERNYRLLSTGELIEVTSEADLNLIIAHVLGVALSLIENGSLIRRIRTNSREIQVPPVGDMRVNRKPDLMVIRSEQVEAKQPAIFLDMSPPLFIAEVVSPGGENSENYKRDYVWKRQQYEEIGVLEYWIVDPHREQVTALVLTEGAYEGRAYDASEQLSSGVFPALSVNVGSLLKGELS